MNELTYDRIKDNLEILGMKHTLTIIDNYLEAAIHDTTNVVEVLDDLLSQEAQAQRSRASENQIEQIMELATMRFVENRENVVFLGTPGVGKTHLAVSLGMIAASNRYSTHYFNCHELISILNKAQYENRLEEKLKVLSKYRVLIIDEIGYLPMAIQGANLFFQLITRRYEKNSTIFTSNKSFSAWDEVFSDLTIASAILDRILHHCQLISIKSESYRLKERKELMKEKQKRINTLFNE